MSENHQTYGFKHAESIKYGDLTIKNRDLSRGVLGLAVTKEGLPGHSMKQGSKLWQMKIKMQRFVFQTNTLISFAIDICFFFPNSGLFLYDLLLVYNCIQF